MTAFRLLLVDCQANDGMWLAHGQSMHGTYTQSDSMMSANEWHGRYNMAVIMVVR
jgi:hypothetical protein